VGASPGAASCVVHIEDIRNQNLGENEERDFGERGCKRENEIVDGAAMGRCGSLGLNFDHEMRERVRKLMKKGNFGCS